MEDKLKNILPEKADPRYEKINDLFINYSLGNFDHKAEISSAFDEVDAFICSIHMLGEELKASTISRDYFNNIFNSVSDMLFVLDNEGFIKDVNKQAAGSLIYEEDHLEKKSIDLLTGTGSGSFFERIKSALGDNSSSFDLETLLYSSEGKTIPVYCSASFLYNQYQKKIGYLIIARDQSRIKKYEKSLQDSREKYRRIFDESSDPIFIISENGIFRDLNSAGLKFLACKKEEIKTLSFFDFMRDEAKKHEFIQKITTNGGVIDLKLKIKNTLKVTSDCLVSAIRINDENGKPAGYHGIIKDISRQKEIENRVIRTIVDTQEKERKRFAREMHDSLGQQLSGIKFYLDTLKNLNCFSEQKAQGIYNKSTEAIDNVMTELRNICFNLMPGTLQNFGLRHAVHELCKKFELANLLKFNIYIHADFPELHKSLEIALFRIIQEFINNSIRHGRAGEIQIDMNFSPEKKKVYLLLRDNGRGFVVKKISEYRGMGFRNVKSRVESYNGELKIMSALNKGTRYEIMIPAIPLSETGKLNTHFKLEQNEKNENINRRRS